ncbi:MAG: helix-turn-helix transcriptional regulator, partial [Alphaproteobacteria bacterium]|nr:helix-turn-helix transcriptional regulator [Alphaproteobacteria bacterium]
MKAAARGLETMPITPRQIRAARAMLDVKQRDLAAAAGISLATLNNIERGVADPRSSTLAAIERALKDAGIEVGEDGLIEEVRLHRVARPNAYD